MNALDIDLLLYGNSFRRLDTGERLDPYDVVIDLVGVEAEMTSRGEDGKVTSKAVKLRGARGGW